MIKNFLIGMSIALVLHGCSDSLEPVSGDAARIVLGTNGLRYSLRLVDVESGDVARKIEVARWADVATTARGDESILVLGTQLERNDDGSRDAHVELIEVDPRSLTVRRRDALDSISKRNPEIGGLKILGRFVAATPDGEFLLLRGYVRETGQDDVSGLVLVRRETLTPHAFIPNVSPMRSATVPASPAYPDGAMALIGTSEFPNKPTNGLLWLMDARTLEIADTAHITEGIFHEYGGLLDVAVDDDGGNAFIATDEKITKYDLHSGLVAGEVERAPGSAALAVSGGGSTLLVAQGGYGQWPGTGYLYVYGHDLTLSDSIDVGARMRQIAVTGDTTFVVAGVTTPFYSEPLELFVLVGREIVEHHVLASETETANFLEPTR